MKPHFTHILKKLDKRKAENSFRELKVNNNSIDFCSNDYLGLASEEEIHILDNIKKFGSTGSRLISGNFQQTVEVENFLAAYYKAESGLLFNSGYTANTGLFSCISQRTDTIIYDELIHASIRDGINLSNSKSFSFKHNDINSLKEKMAKAKGNIFVAVESIYSMDGDMAPLIGLVDICNNNGAALIVDEAHASGIFGDRGQGLVAHFKLENEVFARIVTFGKAFGSHGAIVLGNKLLRDYLINFSRSFIYTTALPLNNILAIKKGHQFLIENLDRKDSLHQLIKYFKLKINQLKLSVINSDSAIQCIVISGNDAVKNMSDIVQNKGFDVRPILSPTVKKGQERLRICLHSFNTKNQIDELLKIVKEEI